MSPNAQSDAEDDLKEDLEECYGERLDGNNCEDVADEDYEGLEEEEQDHREEGEDGEVTSEAAPRELLVSLCYVETFDLCLAL